jgi:hypothetical protein
MVMCALVAPASSISTVSVAVMIFLPVFPVQLEDRGQMGGYYLHNIFYCANSFQCPFTMMHPGMGTKCLLIVIIGNVKMRTVRW